MPKLKTSTSITKRFKVTATGKLLRHKACRSHLLEKKSPKRKNNLSQVVCTDLRDSKKFLCKLKTWPLTLQTYKYINFEITNY